ncbi:MAG: galactokinase [Coriobacteriales bacterium]|nr:galactokinase [Coriobacteriales bacterium]
MNVQDIPACFEVFSPGRAEICGNHTDHEGGHVVAAALDAGIKARVVLHNSQDLQKTVLIKSEGFENISLNLDEPGAFEPRESEYGTTISLVRGMLALMKNVCRPYSGFTVTCESSIPAGGGLSSSAAFELMIGVILNHAFAEKPLEPSELAILAREVEEWYFGKPCGLMDQLAIAHGGFVAMDFADAAHPQVESLNIDFGSMGLAHCLIDTHSDHSACTEEYNLVPREMQDVAQMFGKTRLCEVTKSEVMAQAQRICRELGERAFLRALHFYREEALTQKRIDALTKQDAQAFCTLTRESNASSAMLLQNVWVSGKYQPAMAALAHAQDLLDSYALQNTSCLRGAARIHGGGFGGSIQAFVPIQHQEEFKQAMDSFLGEGSCNVFGLGMPGARVTVKD